MRQERRPRTSVRPLGDAVRIFAPVRPRIDKLDSLSPAGQARARRSSSSRPYTSSSASLQSPDLQASATYSTVDMGKNKVRNRARRLAELIQQQEQQRRQQQPQAEGCVLVFARLSLIFAS